MSQKHPQLTQQKSSNILEFQFCCSLILFPWKSQFPYTYWQKRKSFYWLDILKYEQKRLQNVPNSQKMTHYRDNFQKSRIRETKHLWTDAHSSTIAIGGWTKNTPKPDFFEKRKKINKNTKKSETSRNITKLAISPSTRGL